MFRNFLLYSNPVYRYIHTCHNTNSISYRNFVISHAKNWAHLHNLLIFSMYMHYKLCPHICKYLFPNVSAECTCNCLKIPILTLWYLCHIHRKSINGYSGYNVSQDLLVISTPHHYLPLCYTPTTRNHRWQREGIPVLYSSIKGFVQVVNSQPLVRL